MYIFYKNKNFAKQKKLKRKTEAEQIEMET